MSAPPAQNYLRVAWNGRVWILIGTLLLAGTGFIRVWQSVPLYRSSVTLLIYPSTIKSTPARGANEVSLSELFPHTLPHEIYVTLAMNPELIREIADQTELRGMPVQSVQRLLSIDSSDDSRRRGNEPASYPRTLVFACTHTSPDVAANVVEVWATTFKRRVDALMHQGLDETSELVESMYAKARTDLNQADEALRAFEAEWNLEWLYLERQAMQTLLTELAAELDRRRVELVAAEARLAIAQEAKSVEPPVIVVRKAPPDNVYWDKKIDGDDEALNSDDVLLTEELNPHYDRIQENLIVEQMIVADTRTSCDALAQQIEELRAKIKSLNETESTKKVTHNLLLREQESQAITYQLVLEKREQSKIASVSESSDIHIASNAVVPMRPQQRQSATLEVAAFALFGFLLSLAYVVVAHALRADAKPTT